MTLYRGYVDQQNRRGYGLRYIQETTDLTLEEIGAVMENGEVVEGPGDVQYIIGEVDKTAIILTIIGGALLAGEDFARPVDYDSSESNCNTENFIVETENERNNGPDNPEHTLRDEKPINDIDKLDDILKNPDRLIDYGPRRYLFKAYDNGKTAVIKLHKNFKYDAVYELITQLTDDNSFYDSIDDAADDIKNEEEDGKEPTKDVKC